MKEHRLTEKLGHYSGNRRLDISACKEPIKDDAEERKKWLEGGRKVRLKRKLKRWKNNVSISADPENIIVHLVGQSHIDVAWMWRIEQTRKKAQVTFRKAIFHSEIFPDRFHFALSQPILLEWIKEENLALFRKIQEKVKSGHIELVGGSYVEPDCMMPSAEAMIRQRIYGMRFYKTHFNVLPKIEWFLDSFGYNYGLPQILAKSGVEYFWTTKLTWNRDTTFPFVHFWWKSPDGTELLTCNFHYDPQVLEMWEDFEVGRHLLKKKGKKVWNYADDYDKLKNHVEAEEICPHIGFFFGQSDGGHGPTHQEVAEANKLDRLSWFKWSSIREFFDAIEEYSDRFPVWDDELYLEFHRGCFSNHPKVKRYNRKYETLLTSLESLEALTKLYNSSYKIPLEDMENLWKTTLKNQFHDILPGSSIPEVYDDCWEDWLRQDEKIEGLKSHIGNFLSKNGKNRSEESSAYLFLYNPVSWERIGRVFIPASAFPNFLSKNENEKPKYAKVSLLNDKNNEYICQPVAADPEGIIDPYPAGWWTVLSLAPLSITAVKIELMNKNEIKAINDDDMIRVSRKNISNGKVYIKINQNNGALQQLTVNGINKGNNLIQGEDSNLAYGFRDRVPIRYHAWNLTPEYWEKPLNFSHSKDFKIQVAEKGPIFSTIKIQKTIGKSSISQTISVFKDCPEIFFDYYTDWQQKDSMLKIKYAPYTDSREVIADGMACAIKSKVNPKTPCDKARFEKICHNYCDLSTPDNKWGIALLNEGKYAYDVIDDGFRLTLLRACRYPETAPEAWVNKERELNKQKFGHTVPEYTGLGAMSCRYALLPHNGGALRGPEGKPNTIVTQRAEEFNNPVMVIPTAKKPNLHELESLEKSIFTITPSNVQVSALKANEWEKDQTIIIRFFENCGEASEVVVEFNPLFAKRVKKVLAVDLLEREIDAAYSFQKEGSLRFPIKKFELRTFKLKISWESIK